MESMIYFNSLIAEYNRNAITCTYKHFKTEFMTSFVPTTTCIGFIHICREII